MIGGLVTFVQKKRVMCYFERWPGLRGSTCTGVFQLAERCNMSGGSIRQTGKGRGAEQGRSERLRRVSNGGT